jgi:hypothetical protein
MVFLVFQIHAAVIETLTIEPRPPFPDHFQILAVQARRCAQAPL